MSLTYVGVLVLLLSGILKSAGVEIANDQLTNFVLVFGQIIGAAVALYGRFRAGGINIFGGRT